MDIIFPIIGGLIALAIPILVVIGIVYFIMRLRNNSPMRFFPIGRLCVRIFML